jgi:hypothetical protein
MSLGADEDAVMAATRQHKAMTTLPIRDVSLFVDVVGHGYPLLLMHGGP